MTNFVSGALLALIVLAIALSRTYNRELWAVPSSTTSSVGRQQQQYLPVHVEEHLPQARLSSSSSFRYYYRPTPDAALTLLPGELPGYTGWFRPSSTLAQHFRIVSVDGPVTKLGTNWTVRIQCDPPPSSSSDDDDGQQHQRNGGGSFFYVRAYGRSILPGVVDDYRNGTYDVTILPFDAGVYQLEVVLTFSKPPRSLWELPVQDEVAYEGYLLPGFPIELNIHPPTGKEAVAASFPPPKRLCEIPELLETSRRSAVESGRWLVTSKITEQPYSSDIAHHNATFLGYQVGTHSLGFQAEYFPLKCGIISQKQVQDPNTLYQVLQSTKMPPKPIHVLFIGDSNMRIQKYKFDTYFGGAIRTELVSNYNGIVPTLESVKQRLDDLQTYNSNDATYFVIFNSGLHDIDKLCTNSRIEKRREYINVPDANFSCFEQYNETLEQFVDAVMAFPSALTVWQTTTAGWPKWGVYGAAWRPNVRQVVSLSTNAVEQLNDIAWQILERKKVPVMDGYWLSFSRPDNREINSQNDLSRHLVHPGNEVLSVLTRKWAMMILETIRDWDGSDDV